LIDELQEVVTPVLPDRLVEVLAAIAPPAGDLTKVLRDEVSVSSKHIIRPALPILLGIETTGDHLPVTVPTRLRVRALAVVRELHRDVLASVRPLDRHLASRPSLPIIAAAAPPAARGETNETVREGEGRRTDRLNQSTSQPIDARVHRISGGGLAEKEGEAGDDGEDGDVG
jgi:hypothetical protein